MNVWNDVNQSILFIKLTEIGYAKSFINKGTVKFNTPTIWAKYAQKYGCGRGDPYEGTLAFCDLYDLKQNIKLSNIYSNDNILNFRARDLSKILYNQKILFKDKRSMNLPCYCLYAMKTTNFPVPKSPGKCTLRCKIDGSYFKDFVDNVSKNEVMSLPHDNQPAVIIIKDFNEFKNRLIKCLIRMGVKRDEIIINYVIYEDFNKYGNHGWMDFQQRFPNELFIKNKRFNNQSELRIVVNSKNDSILKQFATTLDLGNMSDIAQMFEGYYPDGMDVCVNASVYCENESI